MNNIRDLFPGRMRERAFQLKARRDTGVAWHEPQFVECKQCGRRATRQTWAKSLFVCPNCGNHQPIGAYYRLSLVLDSGSFRELDEELAPQDVLHFPGYPEKLSAATAKTGLSEAAVTAVGRIGGEIVCEHDLVTYGAPHHLSAEWDEAPLAAGGDTLEVLFTLRDEAGQVVQASDRQVTVHAEGAAAVEAMNAGNLSDPSNYYADHYTLYRGRVKALLRSGAQAGEATLTASCPGVPELTVTIPVQ